MADIDPAQIMAQHERSRIPAGWDWCLLCDTPWPCLPYRLAEALAAERARFDNLCDESARWTRESAERYLVVVDERDAERARVQRVEAVVEAAIKPGTHPTMIDFRDLAAALAGDTKPSTQAATN